MSIYLAVHGTFMVLALIFIIVEIRRSGGGAFLAAICGAVIMLSSQFWFIYATGKVPPGLVVFAEEVNENRAK